MKTFIKLLLLAAVALPAWLTTAAQDPQSPRSCATVMALEVNSRAVADAGLKGNPINSEQQVEPKTLMRASSDIPEVEAPKQAPRKKADPNAPAIFVQTEHDADTPICDGSDNNEFLPFNGTWFDTQYTESQMIYPKEYLAAQGITKGAVINAITFYSTSNVGGNFSRPTYQVRIANTSVSNISSRDEMLQNHNDINDIAFSGNLPSGNATITITLPNPLIYDGENIIIDTYVSNTNSNFVRTYWLGTNTGISGTSYYYYYNTNYTNGTADTPSDFLPKVTFSYTYYTFEPTEDIDFGDVVKGSSKDIVAKFQDLGSGTTVGLSTTSPFSVTPASVGSDEEFTLTFEPTELKYYSDKLNIQIGEQNATVNMSGVGVAGPNETEKAVRDKEFFEGIEYTWPIVDSNGLTANSKKSNLSEIATDPDQIIAMVREVYTNKTIPGNFKRGYSSTGGADVHDDVSYTGVGTIVRTGSTTARFNDTYGWHIPGDVDASGTMGNSYYRYWNMDPEQYKPKYEGVTLLLMEMVDTFNPKTASSNKTGYEGLRDYISQTIKTARVITEAKRTGNVSDKSSGTMFKIDCDKMNKFYLLAKGQLQLLREVWYLTRTKVNSYSNPLDFYVEPCYVYGSRSNYYDNGAGSIDQFSDSTVAKYPFIFGHMFEQFSPAAGNSTDSKTDIYQELTKNMETFGVIHDCPNVPYVQNGHHFMMYGQDSGSEDCQDVRDMMFFVPDYRMLNHSDRGSYSGSLAFQDYFRYNPEHQPTMGLFVIVQDPIPEGQIKETYEVTDPENENAVTGLYQHQLKWKSNLNKFLPSDEQYYELWEVIINDYGIEEYVPVYERNADGSYVLDSNGNKKPVILNRNAAVGSLDDDNNVVLVFENVYVDMHPGSQTKTYVIRGRDKGDAKGPFLTLQMSNKESIVIPGTDPNEKVRMIGTTHYSRFNPQDTTNCYSNKLQIVDNSLTESELASGLSFTRTYRPAKLDENGNVITDGQGNIEYVEKENAITQTIATGRYSATDKKIYIALNTETQASKEAFPKPKYVGPAPDDKPEDIYDRYLDVAGYHANPVNANNEVAISVDFEGGKLNFKDFSFWDNFTADVSQNAHPFQYAYKMHVGEAYSNNVSVAVYKTDTKINSFTLGDVLSDQQMSLTMTDTVKLQGQVQYGSKTELLRYDVYRWDESNGYRYIVKNVGVNDFENDEEADIAPDGQANNEGEYYTVRMNSGENEQHTADVPVSQTNPRGWAKYVDLIPHKNGVGAYDYASVVEAYGFGLKEKKEEVNATTHARDWVERDDYNTYGGPMKTAAIGKLELSVYEPKDAEVHGNDDHEGDVTLAQMSDYKWYDGGKWYSYYNIYLNFKTLNVPEGYELYKVRAWRRVAEKDLGEEIETRQGRVTGDWYMYEDINYGDYLGPQKTAEGESVDMNMELSNIGSQSGYLLGHRSTSIAKPKNPVGYSGGEGGGTVFEYDDTPNPNHDNQDVETLIKNEMRATFGALRMKTDDCPNGIESLNAEFKVRAYFTRGNNKLIQDPQGSTNWGRDGKAQQIVPGSDFDYYIAEGSKTFELTSDNIITGIGAVKMDVNREVVSVSYVNTVGQVSSTPWQGINMVVTRYSDGSTTTKKVIR